MEPVNTQLLALIFVGILALVGIIAILARSSRTQDGGGRQSLMQGLLRKEKLVRDQITELKNAQYDEPLSLAESIRAKIEVEKAKKKSQ